MATTIRMGSFETNSSSTHSLVLMNTDEYRQWANREIVYDDDAGVFVEKQAAADETFSDFVHIDMLGNFEANDPGNWEDVAVARSLNDCGIASIYYFGARIDDSVERNGMYAVSFELGGDI